MLGLALTPWRAGAQLVSAEAYVDIDAGVSAADEGLFDGDSFSDGPRSFDVFLAGGSLPWDLEAFAGGGTASSQGNIQYLATNTSQIYVRGDFDFSAQASSPAAASAGFDATLGITFQLAEVTTFTITGYVSTARALDAPEVVACQFNQTKLAGDSRAAPLSAGLFAFSVERTLYPEETGDLECAAASSGGTADSNTLVWDVTINGLPEPESALASAVAVGVIGVIARRRG